MGKLKEGGFESRNGPSDEEVLRKAGDALARVLGPVHELFEEGALGEVYGAFMDFYTPLSYAGPPLRLKKKAEVR
jgi:hypothetical protein